MHTYTWTYACTNIHTDDSNDAADNKVDEMAMPPLSDVELDKEEENNEREECQGGEQDQADAMEVDGDTEEEEDNMDAEVCVVGIG